MTSSRLDNTVDIGKRYDVGLDSALGRNVLLVWVDLCLHFIKHFYFLRGIVLLKFLWMALSSLARQRSLLHIRDLPLCLAAEIGIQHIPGVSNSLGRVRARLFTHANQRSVKGNDVSGFLIRDGSVLALRFRDDGYTRFIMFRHYPPTNILERHSSFRDTGIR